MEYRYGKQEEYFYFTPQKYKIYYDKHPYHDRANLALVKDVPLLLKIISFSLTALGPYKEDPPQISVLFSTHQNIFILVQSHLNCITVLIYHLFITLRAKLKT